MCKKQQMRRTRPGAQYLVHARTAMIKGELGRCTGLGEGERSPPETPRFLPLSHQIEDSAASRSVAWFAALVGSSQRSSMSLSASAMTGLLR